MKPTRLNVPGLSQITPATALLAALLTATLSLQSLNARADTLVRTTSYEYDTSSGQLTKETIEPNDLKSCLQTSYGFDTYGNKTSTSKSACAGATAPTTNSAATPRTHTDNYGADGHYPVTSTNALNQSETKTYDPRFGTLTSLSGPNGLVTRWEYDNFGHKTKEVRADGTYTTWAYKLCTEAGANCLGPIGGATITWVAIEQSYTANTTATVNSPEKRQYFDTLNRVVRVQTQGFDGNGTAAPTLVQDTQYNALGQIAHQSNTYALNTGTPVWSDIFYDSLGRTATQSQPDPAATKTGGIATTRFDYNALSTTVTNANGQPKTTTKNAQGQVALVTDAKGSTIAYSYDALGQLLQTNAAGSITAMQYNQRGQKIAMQDPAMGIWVYDYNAFGELVYQRDSLGQATTLAYDVLGRMTQRVEPDLTSTWRYDTQSNGSACGKSAGKLCEAKTDNGYLRTHNYDVKGRLDTTTTVLDSASTAATVSQTFNIDTGRVNSKTWPTGYQASYGYTPLGYLQSVTGGGN
jgi:YD repeat-containing protein